MFTGGSLLFGSVGRTDLVGPEHTHELTHAQFHSARRLAAELPDEAPVYPTHGFGSFCSAGAATGGDESTMGAERERNDALTADDEQEFVDRLIANLTAYPAYYVHMGPMNLGGPGVPPLDAPTPADPDELAKRIAAGEWVVDLRSRTAFAADHVEGTISIELGEQFATFVGWLMPWDMPLTILAESADDVAAAQRQLMRIGIDDVAATATGALDDTAAGLARASYPRVSFAEVPDRPAGEVILDVRRDDERRDTYIEGSAHVPLHSLLSRLDEVPSGRVWVHCASGFRAGIASSLLRRARFDVVHVDDEFTNATKAGLAVVEGEQ